MTVNHEARLVVDGLSASYGQALALRNVSLTVGEGEVVGVLGRNGAGKTTLLRTIALLQQRTSGKIHFDGSDFTGKTAVQAARAGISLVREGARVPASLTVQEVLELGTRLRRLRGRDEVVLDEVWEWFPLLVPLRQKKAGLLSGGERQTLALATAFHSAPELLMLDEPSAGLAPQVSEEVFATIGRFAAGGVTALIVEQDPRWLRGLVDRTYSLDLGEIQQQVTNTENG